MITPTINFIEGIEVLPPVLFHSSPIILSELVVLSFIPDTECILESVFFNQSQRQRSLTETGMYIHMHTYSQCIDRYKMAGGGSGCVKEHFHIHSNTGFIQNTYTSPNL